MFVTTNVVSFQMEIILSVFIPLMGFLLSPPLYMFCFSSFRFVCYVFRYKCSQCSYETLRFYRIKEHLVKHMNHNETPAYKCDVCHFQTKYKASLSHHKRTHKKKEETRRDQLNQTA